MSHDNTTYAPQFDLCASVLFMLMFLTIFVAGFTAHYKGVSSQSWGISICTDEFFEFDRLNQKRHKMSDK